LREQQSPRENQLDRRHAELALDDTADLPRAQFESGRDRLEARVVAECVIFEPLHDQVSDALRVVDRRIAGRELGPAAQTPSEARLLGFLWASEEPAVPNLRRLRRAHGAAVDAGRRHADEERAVEARVARDERFVEYGGL